MGINDLWQILSELCERKPLTYLSGKRVAVDLSGWVVQADSINVSKNHHLKTLFFRVARLLQLGVYPIFVTEGQLPSLKEAAFKERNCSHFTENGSSNSISRKNFDKKLAECHDLLNCLGVPCIKSSGEAEAFCAYLFLNDIVSGVITEDSDTFLYGADVVYKDFNIDEKDSHVDVYCLKSEKNKHKLDREKLVALALLLGCDYSKGVPGIGKVAAIDLLTELGSIDLLKRFKDWKNLAESELFPGLEDESVKKSTHCGCCGHVGSTPKHKKEGCAQCKSETNCLSKPDNPCTCEWHVKEELRNRWKTELKIYHSVKKNCPDFPDEEVIKEFLNFNDSIPCNETLKWNRPNYTKFQEKAFDFLGWTLETVNVKFLPIITSWQQYKIKNGCNDKASFIYEPVEVLKVHCLRGVTHYDVQWKEIGSDSSDLPKNPITLEYGEQFFACYKKLVDEYHQKLADKKAKKKLNYKQKKMKTVDGNRKIHEFFR